MPPRPGYFPGPHDYRPYYDSAPPVSTLQAAGPRQPQKRKRHGKRNGNAAKRRRGGLQGKASGAKPGSFEVQASRKPWYRSRSRHHRAERTASRFPAARAETPSTIPRTTPHAPYNSSSFLLQREWLIPSLSTQGPPRVTASLSYLRSLGAPIVLDYLPMLLGLRLYHEMLTCTVCAQALVRRHQLAGAQQMGNLRAAIQQVGECLKSASVMACSSSRCADHFVPRPACMNLEALIKSACRQCTM